VAGDLLIELGAWITRYGAALIKALQEGGVTVDALATSVAEVESSPWFLRRP
jgi:hypothetical protein